VTSRAEIEPRQAALLRMNTRNPGNTKIEQVHNPNDTQKLDRDGWPTAPELPALDLFADRLRQGIVWALAQEPRTPTALARALSASQPLISKHLAILRAAGIVESHTDEQDHRARVYDLRREQFIRLHVWLNDIQRNWLRRHAGPTDPDYYKSDRLDPNYTTRRTPRQRIPRALKEPWER
jgi:DNA-binding transcriptional ArsR family regulator